MLFDKFLAALSYFRTMDITQLFSKLEETQKQLGVIKERLINLTITKETGAGLVKATVNGEKKLIALTIDKTLFDPDNQSMIEDLIIGAINLAWEEVDHKAQEIIQGSMMHA